MIAGVIILLFVVFKGCKQSRIEVAAREKAEQLADSTLNALKEYKAVSDSTKVDFEIKNELLTGQVELANNQKDKAEANLEKQVAINNALIEKHKLAQYTDTTATIVPREYLTDCEGCFINLEKTNKEVVGYKNDVHVLQDKLKQQDAFYKGRFKQLNDEKIGFYNRINSLAKQQKEDADKLKPHGRLYVSWAVLWHGWPSYAGAGLLYQTKHNFIYGAKCFYGTNGMLIETTMNFPLSIKF